MPRAITVNFRNVFIAIFSRVNPRVESVAAERASYACCSDDGSGDFIGLGSDCAFL